MEKYGGGEPTPEDLSRLRDGEPVEYVIGKVSFLGAKIDLTLRPMIPRPETAFWVARAIDELQPKAKMELRLADTFSGAGNVGVSLLLSLPGSTCDFSELDPRLSEQIKINIAHNGIAPHRASILTAHALDELTGPYDAIFAVPPYVCDDALPDLDPEMRDFEPHLAFFGGHDGHDFHRTLIHGAWDLLAPGGSLYMEADMDHNDWVRAEIAGAKWSMLEFWPDPYGATPNVVLRK
jgi:release factor glutamine methyltransferase